jgi:predicted deacetylase
LPDGRLEGFLLARNGTQEDTKPIGSNAELVGYLRSNPAYQIVQHGFRHDYFEFDRLSAKEVEQRLEQGTRLLLDAGFSQPQTFVAPYDKLSRASLRAVAKRFPVLSTGWFELRRLPVAWWPNYFSKKVRKAAHWRVGQTTLLSHPGCLLSCHRDYDGMLQSVIDAVNSRQLTVLVTHWWEYFRDQKPDERFVHFLHQTADYLSSQSDIRVIAFSDLVRSKLRLN